MILAPFISSLKGARYVNNERQHEKIPPLLGSNVTCVGTQRAPGKSGLGVLRKAAGEVRNNVDWLLGPTGSKLYTKADTRPQLQRKETEQEKKEAGKQGEIAG